MCDPLEIRKLRRTEKVKIYLVKRNLPSTLKVVAIAIWRSEIAQKSTLSIPTGSRFRRDNRNELWGRQRPESHAFHFVHARTKVRRAPAVRRGKLEKVHFLSGNYRVLFGLCWSRGQFRASVFLLITRPGVNQKRGLWTFVVNVLKETCHVSFSGKTIHQLCRRKLLLSQSPWWIPPHSCSRRCTFNGWRQTGWGFGCPGLWSQNWQVYVDILKYNISSWTEILLNSISRNWENWQVYLLDSTRFHQDAESIFHKNTKFRFVIFWV